MNTTQVQRSSKACGQLRIAVCTLISVFTILGLALCFTPGAQAQDDTYGYSYSSWGSFAQDLDHTIREKSPQILTIGTSIQEIGGARIDWPLVEMRGEKTSFFDKGPYRAPFGVNKKLKNQTLAFDTQQKTRVTYLQFEEGSEVVVEKGTELLFDDVIFKGNVRLRGFAEFKNCKFEPGSRVIFEKGHASYTGSTNTPQEEGEKAHAFTPLSLTLTPNQQPLPDGLLNKEYVATCALSVAGTHHEKATYSVLADELVDTGLSAVINDDKTMLTISGTPSKAGTYRVSVSVQAPGKTENDPDERVEQSVQFKVYPPVELILVGTPQVVTRHTTQYQQNLKVQVKVGDEAPVDLRDFKNNDPDGSDVSEIKVLTPESFPQGMRVYFMNGFNQVVVAGDNPECDFAGKAYRDFPFKLSAHIKGQDVVSNETKLRVYDSEVSLKQQLAGVYVDEGAPQRWEMQPYFIYTSDGARIPNSMKVLMGSDCHNGKEDDEKAPKNSDSSTTPQPIDRTEARSASMMHASWGRVGDQSLSHGALSDGVPTFSSRGIVMVKTVTYARDRVLQSENTIESRSSKSNLAHEVSGVKTSSRSYPDLILDEGSSHAHLHQVDAITMASSGGNGSIVPGDGGAGSSGSCYYGVLGKGENGNYATDVLYIPAGTDVEFLNMKVLSSIKIVVEDGGHLTLDDSAIFGIIEVEKGGTISAKNSSAIMGKILMKDGSLMKDLAVKSHTNLLSDGNDERVYPESVVEIHGKVKAEGINVIQAGSGPDYTNKTKDSQTGLIMKTGSELIISPDSVVDVQGGNSEIYTTEGTGGVAIVMEEASQITGEGVLKATGGYGYENPGGVGVSGTGSISTARAEITGGDAKSVVGVPADGAYAVDGNIKVAPETKLTMIGGQGVSKDRVPTERRAEYNPAYKHPQGVKAEPLSKIRIRHVDAETSASIKAHPDTKIKDHRLGDVLNMEHVLNLDGYVLKHLEFVDHKKPTAHSGDHSHSVHEKERFFELKKRFFGSLGKSAEYGSESRSVDSPSDTIGSDHSEEVDYLIHLTELARGKVPQGARLKMSHELVGRGVYEPFEYLGISTKDLVVNAVYEAVSDTEDPAPSSGGLNPEVSQPHADVSEANPDIPQPEINPVLDSVNQFAPGSMQTDDSYTTGGQQQNNPSCNKALVQIEKRLIPKTGDTRSLIPLGLLALAVFFCTGKTVFQGVSRHARGM